MKKHPTHESSATHKTRTTARIDYQAHTNHHTLTPTYPSQTRRPIKPKPASHYYHHVVIAATHTTTEASQKAETRRKPKKRYRNKTESRSVTKKSKTPQAKLSRNSAARRREPPSLAVVNHQVSQS